jgi:2-keto-4-pentenoate hydratase/2-oxohepta-3-ene-1,7-dioic acid hydratase in catechol pathway
MRTIRFIDERNQMCFGSGYDGQSAELLSASPLEGGEPTGERATVQQMLCPIQPPVIMCIGLNYRRHAEETGATLPDRPVLFMKNPAAAQHPGKPIVLPEGVTDRPETDYECELAAVIGKPTKNVSEDDALDYVFGYTVANDVSARRWQKDAGGGQWIRGKSFDTFCPFGPEIVTPDELDSYGGVQNLEMSTTLNGEIMQQSNTSDMIFTVARIISYISKDTTLLPGTLVLTGTPEGVGFARDPRVFLVPGDTVTCSIQGLGDLTNPVIARP